MFIKRTSRFSEGFTLVELLVVIAIIGVLATLLLLQLGVARAKARDAKRIADINQLRTAMELYFDDNQGHYPTALSITTGDPNSLAKYFTSSSLPVDPVTGANYFYAYNPSTKPIQFDLWAELEQSNAAALAADADIDSTGWSGDAIDANDPATEACTAAYAGGAARDCVYDQGQK